jgi:ribosomal protein S18 acetylase RimI-like enzyme
MERDDAGSESSPIVGYFHLYHGMPKPEVVFISMCVIDPVHQKRRYGSELIEGLVRELRAIGGYEAIWLNVYLKNWPALHHWIGSGFTTIREWRGDTTHTPEGHASLILERKLGLPP